MRAIVCMGVLTFIIQNALSQDLEIYDGYLNKMAVSFFLNTHNNSVEGYYLYNKYGRPIHLNGEIINGKFNLTEYRTGNGKVNDEESARITLNRSEKPEGQWISKSGKANINLARRKTDYDWKVFDIKTNLTQNLSKTQVHEYPVTARIIYPEEGSNLFYSVVPEIFESRPDYNSIWEYFNIFLNDIYSGYLNDFPYKDKVDYYYEMNGSVVFLSETLLSYRVSGYGFAGGAHGQPVNDYYVFDVKSGLRLFLDDVFREKYEKAVAEIIHEKDKKKHGISDIEENLHNFYLTDKGIGFVFNPYDIDCYGCGTFEYFVSFDELRDLLKRKF